jgi:hypothetical protein
MAELVEALDAPEFTPSWVIEELVAELVDHARERAAWERPRLVHVRERPVVDTATGEISYRFEGVLGAPVKGGGRVPLDHPLVAPRP